MRPELQQKYQQLQEHIRSMESAAVAFSGGVDSSLLLAVTQKILGKKVIALTARSCVFPKREWEEATNFTKKLGVFHQVIDVDLLQISGVVGKIQKIDVIGVSGSCWGGFAKWLRRRRLRKSWKAPMSMIWGIIALVCRHWRSPPFRVLSGMLGLPNRTSGSFPGSWTCQPGKNHPWLTWPLGFPMEIRFP